MSCCNVWMAERIHWWTERWLELCFVEWLQWLQWSPHPQLLDVVWCSWHTLGRRPRTIVAFLLIGVGWGGVITFICTSSHIWCYVIVWGGVGWGNNVHLNFLTYMMLRYCMSSCTSSHTWCYATSCRLALPHIYDATLLYVVLHFLTYMMLRYFMSFCTSSHTWCYATSCRLALPHIHDATLLYVVLHFLTYMMLRYFMSSCTSSHTWCCATSCRLALPHIHDATLLYVVLHFLTYMMLRYCMSSCTSSHIWCYSSSCRLGHTLMSEDVKAMVNQWVFRQSLGPITPIAFLEELKQLLKQWGKKGYEVLLRSSLEQCKMRNVKKHWVFCWKSHFVPRPSIKRVPRLVKL